jgi:DnaJ-class molecular chaperone
VIHECHECLGLGYIDCPTCDGEGTVDEEEEQLEGEDWSRWEKRIVTS